MPGLLLGINYCRFRRFCGLYKMINTEYLPKEFKWDFGK